MSSFLKPMRRAYDEIYATALKRQHEPQRLVGDLLKAEISEKHARSIRYKLAIAKLALAKDVDDFQFKSTPINENLVRDLASGEFIAQQRNVVLVGGTLIANVGNEYKVDSLLANLQTKIFAQNTGRTNEWASGLLGERWENTISTGVGHSGHHNAERVASSNVYVSEQKRSFIEPAEFTVLRRGGPANDFQVE